jgi:hypothetical protein
MRTPGFHTGDSSVLILNPAFLFSDYKTGAVLSGEQFNSEAYSARLKESARQQLDKRGFKSAFQEAAEFSGLTDAISLLNPELSRLARGLVTAEARDVLARLSPARTEGGTLIFAQFMKVKADYSGSGMYARWELPAGLGPQMNNLLLQASLLNARTSQVLWKDESFFRGLPKFDSIKFNEILYKLYNNFKPESR